MRILFAALALPYPPMNGHRLRTWAMVRALADEGHEVTVVSFAEPSEFEASLAPLQKICARVELVPVPERDASRGETVDRLTALLAPMPFAARRLRSQAFTDAVARQLSRGTFDVLLCDGIYNMQNLPARPGVPIVLNKDDVAYQIMRRYLTFERHPARRVYAWLEGEKVRRWERAVCRRVALILACSEPDREILRGFAPRVPIAIVPNVVDVEHYRPGNGHEPKTVLFQGGMDWHPNRDAVEFFADAILPPLRRLVPDALFRVAGRSPSDEFRDRFRGIDRMEFTGTVPDMRDEIAKAEICVVPLRIGSGTRLKILEAAAMGKPIVSTTLGAEGLNFVNGEEIVLADDPARFAKAVAELLADPGARRKLGDAARNRAERGYSFAVHRSTLRKALTLVTR